MLNQYFTIIKKRKHLTTLIHILNSLKSLNNCSKKSILQNKEKLAFDICEKIRLAIDVVMEGSTRGGGG